MASVDSLASETMDDLPPPNAESSAEVMKEGAEERTETHSSAKKMKTAKKYYMVKKTDKISSKEDLKDMLSNMIKKMTREQEEQASIAQAQAHAKAIEKRSKEMSKIEADCRDRLEDFRKHLEEEQAAEERRYSKAEADAKDAEMQKERQVVDIDSDDDIKIVGSSFEPSTPGGSKEPLVMKMMHSGQMGNQPPSVDSMRRFLTHTLKIANGKMLQQPLSVGAAFLPLATPQQAAIRPTPPHQEGQGASQAEDLPWDRLTVGSKVFAQKNDEVWYPGTVIEVTGRGTERTFRVKFDQKGTKLVGAKFVAYRESIQQMKRQIIVGTRVVADYREDETQTGSFYAGIVAEAPSLKNQKRYLIFFDDGYAQYSPESEIHKVYHQSFNVWEDIHPDSEEFIREYLKQYPERPMVRLTKGQTVKTEWNGKWWSAKVMEVDASLVKMYFHADRRTEWIYRGSTRLEPLYKALANAERIKKASSGEQPQLRRLLEKTNKSAVVEYTRGATDEDMNRFLGLLPTKPHMPPAEKKKPRAKRENASTARMRNRSTAKKSTSIGTAQFLEEDFSPSPNWVGPWMKMGRNRQSSATATATRDNKEKGHTDSSSGGRDMASVLQERLASGTSEMMKEETQGERMDTVLDIKDKPRKQIIPHMCSPACLRDFEEDVFQFKAKNPLLVPLLCGWERQVCRHRPSNRRTVKYRAPCARSLRTMDEVDVYLEMTDSKLTIDRFCMDPELQVHSEFVAIKTFTDIKDLSYGKEEIAISCTNTIDRQYPDYVEYSSHRIPAKGVVINTDEEFMSYCDCTDNCKDKSKCSCQQLTIQQTTALGERNESAGYHNRLLKEPILTGIYECNPKCKCNSRCHNKVAQNGLRLRLQVFKTEKRGWGLRCLDDIPQGGFICIYAGQLLTEKGANEDGKQYGDEYLAELDFMEVVEKNKAGYESDVADPDDENQSDEEEEEEDDDDEDVSGDDISTPTSDSSYHLGSRKIETGEKKVHVTRKQTRLDSDEAAKQAEASPQKPPTASSSSSGEGEWAHQRRTQEWVENVSKPIVIEDEESGRQAVKEERGVKAEADQEDREVIERLETKDGIERMELDDDELPDLDTDSAVDVKPDIKPDVKPDIKPDIKHDIKQEMKMEDNDSEEDEDSKSAVAKKRTRSRFKNLPNPKLQSEELQETKRVPMRSYFENEQNIYIMDAKSMGNIGRYLNHSCSPNVFVQNVFVDTHDLRFPWVAFFANRYIQAGKELTWDYNYEVGSVNDKVLYCYCGSGQCRGRLL